jgi:hypothetical protein
MNKSLQIIGALVLAVVIVAGVMLTRGGKHAQAPVFSGTLLVQLDGKDPVSWNFNPNGYVTVFNPAGPRLLFSGTYVASAGKVTAKLSGRSGKEKSINFLVDAAGSSLTSEDGKIVLTSTGLPSGAR